MTLKVYLPKPRKRTETDISREIRQALDRLGIPNWRMQAGGYRGRARGLPAGTPDILASPQMNIASHGFVEIRPQFLWIEVKKPGELPTTKQLAFGDRMRNRRHHWLCVESLDEVLDWLRQNEAR